MAVRARRSKRLGAVTLDAAGLKAAVNGLNKSDDATVDRLLAVATEIVEKEAPAASSSLQNEAVIRTAAWLFQSQVSIGQMSSENRTHAMGAFRASGARALLSPWIERTI